MQNGYLISRVSAEGKSQAMCLGEFYIFKLKSVQSNAINGMFSVFPESASNLRFIYSSVVDLSRTRVAKFCDLGLDSDLPQLT